MILFVEKVAPLVLSMGSTALAGDRATRCAPRPKALDEDQFRGGGDGGLLAHPGGFSGSIGRSCGIECRTKLAGSTAAPTTLQHLAMHPASAKHGAFVSQHGQPPDEFFIALWQSAMSAMSMATSPTIIAWAADCSVALAVLAACIAAHALPIGATATDSAIQQTSMKWRGAKRSVLLSQHEAQLLSRRSRHDWMIGVATRGTVKTVCCAGWTPMRSAPRPAWPKWLQS